MPLFMALGEVVDPLIDITSIFDTALSGVTTNVLSMIGTAMPKALTIAGLFIAVRLGIGFFRSVAH